MYTYTHIGGENPKTLHEVKASPDWPKWEKAVKAELEVLDHMGTWKLVERPPDVKPVACRWVFIKKYNKEGELLKYKARLVAKGFTQRPGFEYNDTFTPVVRLETICALLAIVPNKNLKLQQMDVKGAYLHGILQENIYMVQPEGFDDGTSKVCHLVKSLYGLKQSG